MIKLEFTEEKFKTNSRRRRSSWWVLVHLDVSTSRLSLSWELAARQRVKSSVLTMIILKYLISIDNSCSDNPTSDNPSQALLVLLENK